MTMKCGKCNIGNKNGGHKCIIDGKEHPSLKDASLALGISQNHIKKRLTSDEYPNWYFKMT